MKQQICVVNHTPQLPLEKNEDVFGLFNERILELCNHTFSVMYRRVFHRYWNNSIFARVKRNYCATSWSQGTYEFYIPTQERLDGANMQFYRVIVKVLPEIDRETIKREHADLLKKRINPSGVLDSELIVFVAPKLKTKGFLRAFNHTLNKKRGYLTAIIINKAPEICMKRLLTIISNFLKTRLKKLLEKLNFQPWQYDYSKKKNLYYSKICNIIEEFSLSIANTVRCLSHSLSWVLKKLKHVLSEIGRQNMVKMAVKKAYELKDILGFIRFSPKYLRNSQEPPIIKKLITVFTVGKG